MSAPARSIELPRLELESRLPAVVFETCRAIAGAGGRAWLVGGCVRDLLLSLNPKDFDLEVYHLDADTLAKALAPLGRCRAVGRQFGVIKLQQPGHEIDIALPRRERKTGAGHRGFDVVCDPELPPEIASQRRDFTINALMLDPLAGELLDPHHGREDLKRRILRHVSPAFIEDPLRPLRAMQFAARFALRLAPETAKLCASMLAEATSLPGSRIWLEWQKWAHADRPSHGLAALREAGWLGLYPAIGDLIGCDQDPRWHPEGDVWNHTLLVVDQAAGIARDRMLDGHTSEYLVFAALCHDFGKPATSITHANGRIGSPGHSEAGCAPARSFLGSIHAPGRIAIHVLPLIRDHITHLHSQPSPRAVRRLAHRLEPASIELWEMLVQADASGRHPAPPSRPALPWLELARRLRAEQSRPAPIVTGRMLMDLGMKPGPEMGRLIEQAYEAQLDGEFASEDEAREWCRARVAAFGYSPSD